VLCLFADTLSIDIFSALDALGARVQTATALQAGIPASSALVDRQHAEPVDASLARYQSLLFGAL